MPDNNMDTEGFEAWMRRRTPNSGTIGSRVSNLKRVEDAYGDLDAHYQRDGLAEVLGELVYSPNSEELRGNSRIKIDGNVYNGLATLRSAVTLYRKFRTALQAASPSPLAAGAKEATWVESLKDAENSISVTLSLDELSAQLRRHIAQQSGNLTFIQGEPVPGRTVMHGHDNTGASVAVELLTRRATRDDAARFVEDLGHYEEQKGADVRGILVAIDFDPGALFLARKVQSLQLVQCTLGVAFHAIDPAGAATPLDARLAAPELRD